MHVQDIGKTKYLWMTPTRSISINYARKQWAPRLSFHENGGRKNNGDSCFDCSLIIGTIIFSYTNWNLQNNKDSSGESVKGQE